MLALADVAVSVADRNASAAWWREKVGFRVYTLPGADHAMLVAPPGDRFVLHLCEGFEPVSPGNTGIAFMTDDLPGTVQRLTARGVMLTEPPQKETGERMAKFLDPDGNIFWLLGAPVGFIRRATSRRAAGSRVADRGPPRRTDRPAPRGGRRPARTGRRRTAGALARR